MNSPCMSGTKRNIITIELTLKFLFQNIIILMFISFLHLERLSKLSLKFFLSTKKCFSYFTSNNSSLLNSKNILSISKRMYMDLNSVIKVFEQEIPPNLAEKWDNVGLLVEPAGKTNVSTMFFTNDLTEEVVKEAISQKSDLIISYHPPIFSPLKSLRHSNWKHQVLMMCVEHSIVVYSPHTCCDAAKDGVNDWLINCFALSEVNPIIQSYQKERDFSHVLEFACDENALSIEEMAKIPNCQIQSVSSINGKQIVKAKVNETSMKTILKFSFIDSKNSLCFTPIDALPILAHGMGRKGKLVEPIPLKDCIELIKNYLKLNHIRVAKAVSHTLDSPVSVIAVCAGSGQSILKGVAADLFITGEMSHHDLLDATNRNTSVILCEHSNSERGYLKKLVEILSPKLPGVNLIVSSSDKDPIVIV